MKRALLLLPLLGLACKTRSAPDTDPPVAPPPPTEKVPVKDVFHGVEVGEAYRWLEDGDAPEVKAWSAAQTTYARAALDALPHRARIDARVSEVLGATAARYRAVAPVAGGFLALKTQPPKQQPFLVHLASLGSSEARVVIDPNAMDAEGLVHIDWFVPSPDGRRVAVSLSKAGTESGDVHVFEVASGERVHEIIPRVNGGTAGGDLAWTPDGAGFYYTRYPRGDERPPEDRDFYQQLWFHTLGTPTEEDRYVLGEDLPRIAEIQLATAPSGRLVVTVQKGDGGEFRHYLQTDRGFLRLSEFGDGHLAVVPGVKDDLYVLSRAGAPKGRLLRLSLDALDAGIDGAEVVVPEGDATLVHDFFGPATVRVTDHRLYLLYQLGGPSEIRAFTHAGEPAPGPEVPAVSSVSHMVSLGGDDLLFLHGAYTSPPAYLRYDAEADATEKTALATPATIPGEGFEVTRSRATSKDGTEVPVNVITERGFEKDGKSACVVYGYGGYGIDLTPQYRLRNLLFAEQGVVYAVANLRGGGEFGEAWHRQGNLTNKQNVFDDFAATIRHLVAEGYCAPKRVGILGGSNGGLLMGATMVQHPELVRAVVSFVGIYDMLRVELSPNGAFNVTEFGTVEDEAQFQALYAYSPYHNVEDGVAYPPVLFITGENDPRVDPMHSRKMTARLQAASASESPVLLRTTADAGHGGGTALDERIAQYVDMFAFFFEHLGVLPK